MNENSKRDAKSPHNIYLFEEGCCEVSSLNRYIYE